MLPVFLVGPTAVGKSAVALELARLIDSEIVSADSMQVYRGMDIGTAKPTRSERCALPHHLIDICDVTETFDVKRFVDLAGTAIANLQTAGKTALVVGGTGLYVRALRQGLCAGPARDPALRRQLEAQTAPELFAQLQHIDPATAAKIDRHNQRRLVRALEVFHATGQSLAALQQEWGGGDAPAAPLFCLNRDRADLYRRIERRVDAQIAAGWVDEVRELLNRGLAQNATALQAAGYRELVAHLRGELALAAAVALIKTRTRQLAKRQLTWFRREPGVRWLAVEASEAARRDGAAHPPRHEGDKHEPLKMYDTQAPPPERALLVGLERSGHDRWAVKDSLDELRELAISAGATVLDAITQKRGAPAAPTFVGSGKANEIAAQCQETGANTVIFDDDLTPAQGRNLGEVFGLGVKVLDRTELILDIFAQRARTREGSIQVELAQLQYMLPRLTGLWTHLSRQRGGIGSRGPGEQQLEVDRRRIMEKISRLKDDLEEVRKNRRIERSGRQKLHWPLVSIIGYTNSGKSTLMNALTGANVLAEDKLFATLDPTTRKLRLPNNQNILLADTVGFLRKLPHHLVESFKATLEEVSEADLLLHVVDVSHPQAHEQIKAVEVVLHEINSAGKPTVVALNKIDRVPEDAPVLEKFRRELPESVAISAKYERNLTGLLDEIAHALRDRRVNVTLAIPADRAQAIALVYRSGYVTAREQQDDKVVLKAQIPKVLAGELKPYVVETAD